MMYLVLAILIVAAIGLFQSIYQRLAHRELDEERRRRYLERMS